MHYVVFELTAPQMKGWVAMAKEEDGASACDRAGVANDPVEALTNLVKYLQRPTTPGETNQ
jgi:hypothetical protein